MPLSRWPKLFRSHRDARVFFISISLVVMLFLAFISFTRYQTVNELLIRTMQHEAESYASLIILTRHWSAAYGGVYVFKKPEDPSNPYLEQMGIDPDVRTVDGRILTLKSPAVMIHEISKLASDSAVARFHMISLKPVNPENQPDAFEKEALDKFKPNSPPIWAIDVTANEPQFRYIQPVKVERSCLACHERQGYREGDIRGAISILTPAEELLRLKRQNALQKVFDFAAASGLLISILYFLTWKLFVRLDEVQRRLKHIAITDELTGLRNRRHIMEQLDKEYQRAVRSGTSLSLMILDIDHFKAINDQHGHLFGDDVLKAVAHAMEQTLRTYDLLGRIGGEEFLIASPGSSLEDAGSLAERIREKIKTLRFYIQSHEISVTVSAGVTSLGEQDGRMNLLLIRADKALYLAKKRGRDRVVMT